MNHYSLLFALLLSAVSLPAAAYLDPGTGSMILQGVVAAIAVVGLTIKTYWYKLRALFGKDNSASLLDDDDSEDSTQ